MSGTAGAFVPGNQPVVRSWYDERLVGRVDMVKWDGNFKFLYQNKVQQTGLRDFECVPVSLNFFAVEVNKASYRPWAIRMTYRSH